jgi:2'-5' RNA ligase
MARLFFALWPDKRVRVDIQAFASRLSLDTGRLVAARNTHITLAFLGNVDEQTSATLINAVSYLSIEPFSLSLNRLGWWRKPKIAWLAPTDYAQELSQLANELKRLATSCGLNMDQRPYQPHLTLARKVTHPLTDIPVQPIFGNINEFCLLQ